MLCIFNDAFMAERPAIYQLNFERDINKVTGNSRTFLANFDVRYRKTKQ